MAAEDDAEIPETGAVFTFGKSKFGDSAPNKFWIRNDKVLQISCGDEHTGIISESGKLFMFGSNEWGQLGLGHNKVVNKPSRVKALKSEKVVKLACGRNHTLAATETGKVYAFGNNSEGQLGLGDSNSQNVATPSEVQLPALSIRMIDAGNDHSMLLSEEGDVYVWGGSGEGQLGIGEEDEVHTPRKLNIGEKAVCISCGYYHTAIVTESGKLLTCGEGEGGKLGLGESTDSIHVLTEVDGIEGRVVQVACGGSQTIAVTDDGKAYSFGDGANGQLGHGTMVLGCCTPQHIKCITERVAQACCGENHSALVTKKGSLYTFGDGRHGKLALGDENFANQFKPCLVHRFKQFCVESVSCGGCHTLVCAKMSQQNGDVGSGYESGEDQVDNLIGEPDKKTHLTKANHLRDSMDLEGSIGARNRRREKFPESDSPMNRTLPPLSSSNSTSINRTSLPPLESTQPLSLAHEKNSLNASTVPPIQKSQSPAVHAVPRPAAKEEEREESGSSDVSVTESDEESDAGKTPARQQLESTGRARELPKPRPVPRKRPDPLPETKSGKGSPKVIKAEAATVQSKGKKMEEESEEESEETESEEQEKEMKKIEKSDKGKKGKTKKEAPKKPAAKKKPVESASESEDEKSKAKTSKESDHEDTESEEERKKSKKSAPKGKGKKEAPKKRTNIFGKKKLLESEEESEAEESSEEEETKKSKKGKESKADSKISKKDSKKDSKKEDKKGKKKTSDDEEEKEKSEKEEESEESGVDEEAKSIDSAKSKESEKDKTNSKDEQNKPPPKKSGMCALL